MAQGGQVDDETLFPLLDGILALTSDRNPHYNPPALAHHHADGRQIHDRSVPVRWDARTGHEKV
jgi:hypothetical protein